MIVIDKVELSKNPVQTNETLVIKVTAREVLAGWSDLKPSKWEIFKSKTWDAIKRKIF